MTYAPAPIIPNRQIPRVLGIVAIVLGCLALLCNLVSVFMLMVMPQIQQMVQSQQAAVQKTVDSQSNRQIERVKKQLETAQTEEEKAVLEARIRDIEERKPDMSAMTMGFDMATSPDPRVKIFQFIDPAMNMLLGILLILSGVGLVQLRSWAIPLSKSYAVLAILTALGLGLYAIFVVTPIMTNAIGEKFEAVKNMPGMAGNPMADPQMIGAMTTAQYAGGMIVAMIFPVIVLVLLPKKTVQAAFHEAAQQRGEKPKSSAPGTELA
jgi:hypothetical protein